MKKVILFFNAMIVGGTVCAQTSTLLPGVEVQTPAVQTLSSAPLGLTLSTTTSFANNQAMGMWGLQRKKYKSLPPSGNDLNDEVGMWIKGFYQNTGVALPVLLGGYGYNSEDAHMIIDKNGSVGIGNVTPGSWGNQNQAAFPRTYAATDKVLSITDAAQPVLEFGRPVTALSAGERVGAIFFTNMTGQSDAHRQIAGLWAERGDLPSHPHLVTGRLVFVTKTNGGPEHNKMIFDEYGNLSIGTPNSGGYKLAVNGGIKATRVKVTQSEWPDFVFEQDYPLKPLPEVETYIATYKHLPGIPAATEVAANGLDVGDTQARLLQKIEELTLYMIDLNKQDAAQKTLMGNQQAQLQQQEVEIKRLKQASQK